MAKRLKDQNAIDLRIKARGKDKALADEALAELRRRVTNLRGGIIPEWELEARGRDPKKWVLV